MLSIIGGSYHKYYFCREKSFVAANTFLSGQKTCFVAIKVCLSRHISVNLTSFVATKNMFVTTNATKHFYFRDKSMIIATDTCLSRQNIICRDKTFVSTKIFYRDKHNFVATEVFSRQAYFCRDKRRILSSQRRVCRDKEVFVATKMILMAAPATDSYPHIVSVELSLLNQRLFPTLLSGRGTS